MLENGKYYWVKLAKTSDCLASEWEVMRWKEYNKTFSSVFGTAHKKYECYKINPTPLPTPDEVVLNMGVDEEEKE